MPESRLRLEGVDGTKVWTGWTGTETSLGTDATGILGAGIRVDFNVKSRGAEMTAGTGVEVGADTLIWTPDIN